MAKIIKNNLPQCPSADLDSLLSLQGALKKIKRSEIIKLKNSLVDAGIIFPLFIWMQKTSKKIDNWLIDGVQRKKCLLELREAGYMIDSIPVVLITMKSRQEARKMILHASEEFSKMSKNNFNAFVKDLVLDNFIDSLHFTDIKLRIKLPDIFKEDENIAQFMYTQRELDTLNYYLNVLRERYKESDDIKIIIKALEDHIRDRKL